MIQFLVIAEAASDFDLATSLSKQILQEHAPQWLLDNWESLEPLQWVGLESNTSFSAWKNLKSITKHSFSLSRPLGHIPGGNL